jgi:hypothetical protein
MARNRAGVQQGCMGLARPQTKPSAPGEIAKSLRTFAD